MEEKEKMIFEPELALDFNANKVKALFYEVVFLEVHF